MPGRFAVHEYVPQLQEYNEGGTSDEGHGEDDLAEIPAICGWLRRWHEMRVGCARAVYAGSREKTMEDNCGEAYPIPSAVRSCPP